MRRIFDGVYDAEREERKLAGPNKNQEALADLLDSIGTFSIFTTFTFRPNEYECISQSKDGDFYENEKLRMGNTIIKRKTRGYRGEFESGGIVRGSPNISPGWSGGAVERAIERWFVKDRELKKTRWFFVVEGSRHRDCAHGHGMIANCSGVNWDRVDRKWQKEYGRFKVEKIRAERGTACYLAKQYVGKEYGQEDFRYRFSKNCRDPKPDRVDEVWYMKRMYEYKRFLAGKGAPELMQSLGKEAREGVAMG